MIELKNISFSRDGKQILKNINLKLEDNTFVAITGPNGSGKSTLAKIITGIEKADSGKIIFNSKDITNLSVDERANLGISYAFQQPVKFKGITVYDILRIASSKLVTKHEACEMLSKVGLCAKEYIDRQIDASLSGGELKRIEIATVVARKTKLNVFDEPEAGIDLWSFNNLVEIFTNLRRETAATTIVISHQEKILNIADKVVLIKEGQIEKIGTAQDVINMMDRKKECCKIK